MSKLHIVDGSGYIFRAYYAIAPLSNKDGLPTNGIFGFARMLLKLLRDVEARHIVVAFDTGEPTFRHKMFDQYKANRAECPEDLVPQMPYFRKVVEALGIRSLEKPGYEADDIIGTLVERLKGSADEIVIVSGDKDLTQLVNGKVTVWDAMRDIRYDSAQVLDKFGVEPGQIVDYLALTGDSSDNIPGLKGVGPKSAQALLNHLGTLENLLQHPERVEEIKGLRGAKKIRSTVESEAENARLSKRLVQLDLEVPPFNEITDVEEFHWPGPDADSVVALFDELEFSKMLDAVPMLDQSALAHGTGEADADRDYIIVSREAFPSFLEELRAAPSFAFDTETTSLDVSECDLVGISFSWEANKAFYLPLRSDVEPGRCLDAEEVRAALLPIFADEAVEKAGLNLKYDIGVLAEHGYQVRGPLFDAMLASYVLYPESREHGLKALAKSQLDWTMITYEELVGDHEHIAQVELDRVGHYACDDAEVSWRLKLEFEEKLGEREFVDHETELPTLARVFWDVEMPLVSVLSSIERRGIKVNTKFLDELGGEFAGELETLEKRVYELADGEFNLNSPKQLSEVLFERMELPTKGVKKRQSGYSTDASVLQRFAEEYEIAERLLEYRELFKLKSTYVEGLSRLVNPKDGRIHTSFHQAITATGRLSSREPNLQNIPIRTNRGRRIREAFVAPEGSLLIGADYSQIELRVLAHLADDKNLQQAFLDDEDIHTATARDIFGPIVVAGDESGEHRRFAKTINFGIVYGMSAFRLAKELGISRKEAQSYIDNYFARYPKVQEFFTELSNQSQNRGYVETMFGRRRRLADIDVSGRDAGYAERSLMNAPIQGSAAEIIKIAMSRLYREFERFEGRARMVLQVHDELVCEVEQGVVDEVKQVVVEQMESAISLAVPLKVDVGVGTNWGGLK